MSSLFDPMPIRGVTLPNRIVASPICRYSSVDGFANHWHFVRLSGTPEGRISPPGLGIWSDDHIRALSRIEHFVKGPGQHPRNPTSPRRPEGEHNASVGGERRYPGRLRGMEGVYAERDP